VSAGGYEIVRFEPGHFDGVLDVLAGLWPYERAFSVRLFRWKHLENPHLDAPLGIVALHGGRVVGYRGYFADRFESEVGGEGFVVLHPCDTVVSPDHRNRGLSVAMGKLALDFDPARYRLFMNLSAGDNSRPGYLALGFQPLAPRVLLQRHGRNPVNWLRGAWSRRREDPARPPPSRRIRHGRFGDILVADSPRPADMAAIVAAEPRDGAALRLVQDVRFFEWRYRNPVRRYVFFFRMEGDAASAYAALDVSHDGISGSILDYAEARAGALAEVLNFVCKRRDFVALSAFSYGVDARLASILRAMAFVPVHTPKTLLRGGSVEAQAPPILVRPIASRYGEEAFRVGTLDMRRIADWRLKPICSDGA
jgi:GNAT superfamily N-acetyltransferase